MPKRRTRKQRSSVIEIDDSSDSESQSNPKQEKKPTPDAADQIALDYDDDNDNDDDESSTKSSASYSILTRGKLIEQLPIAARTKSAKKVVASMRLMSMNFDGKREGLSPRSQDNITKLSRLETGKKKHSMKDEIQKIVAADMEDPELTRLLRKIAYCRVFTNYLFRQYDMLSIDFQLYSNLEDLMMDLKRRVGAYNAIRRSRQQILFGGSVGGASNSSREGSTV